MISDGVATEPGRPNALVVARHRNSRVSFLLSTRPEKWVLATGATIPSDSLVIA